ncbi:hypothetical protein NVP1121O_033 [Vibrio phage 1.121.O._10N.286.46.C4]|nr:hypothetical protein NVP1121O_033 [Vibrio phage 1.121.O._10N.286.46.C4]
MATLAEVSKYTTKVEGLTQAGGAVEVEMGNWRAPVTQVSFNIDNLTDANGTLDFEVKYHPEASWEVLLDAAGAARTVTLSAAGLQSFTIEDNWVHAIRITPSNVAGNLDVMFYQDALAARRNSTYR